MIQGHRRAVDPLARVRDAVAAREAAGLRRVLRPRGAAEDVLDLAGNDYLGLARDPRVVEAGAVAAPGCTVLHRLAPGHRDDRVACRARAPAFVVVSGD